MEGLIAVISSEWVWEKIDRCEEHLLSPPGVQKFVFGPDSSFVYYHGLFTRRNVGTWHLLADNSQIKMDYYTITWDTTGLLAKIVS